MRRRNGMLSVKALTHGVERTGADVAVNDPEAGETEEKESTTAGFGGRKHTRKPCRISNSRH
jgi:hypothetical protein